MRRIKQVLRLKFEEGCVSNGGSFVKWGQERDAAFNGNSGQSQPIFPNVDTERKEGVYAPAQHSELSSRCEICVHRCDQRILGSL